MSRWKLVGASVAIACPSAAWAQSGPLGAQEGRYVIVHSPHIQRDTVLLDTATGKTWQLRNDPATGEDYWDPLARTDNVEESRDYLRRHPPKPKAP